MTVCKARVSKVGGMMHPSHISRRVLIGVLAFISLLLVFEPTGSARADVWVPGNNIGDAWNWRAHCLVVSYWWDQDENGKWRVWWSHLSRQ